MPQPWRHSRARVGRFGDHEVGRREFNCGMRNGCNLVE